MILEGSTESGAEEWVCPSCGRRMLLRWPPNYEKVVLEHGDDAAIHAGGKGGLRITHAETTAAPMSDVPDAELQWLRDVGIDWDGTPA